MTAPEQTPDALPVVGDEEFRELVERLRGFCSYARRVEAADTLETLLAERDRLLSALQPFAETYKAKSDPGTSDLYDEQPQAWHVPLGAWRTALRVCREIERTKDGGK